jgi:hypothetical protein
MVTLAPLVMLAPLTNVEARDQRRPDTFVDV